MSNPPYSIKWDGDANPLLINDPRFAPAGVLAPKSKADLAFTMHILSWLAVSSTAAIVEFLACCIAAAPSSTSIIATGCRRLGSVELGLLKALSKLTQYSE